MVFFPFSITIRFYRMVCEGRKRVCVLNTYKDCIPLREYILVVYG